MLNHVQTNRPPCGRIDVRLSLRFLPQRIPPDHSLTELNVFDVLRDQFDVSVLGGRQDSGSGDLGDWTGFRSHFGSDIRGHRSKREHAANNQTGRNCQATRPRKWWLRIRIVLTGVIQRECFRNSDSELVPAAVFLRVRAVLGLKLGVRKIPTQRDSVKRLVIARERRFEKPSAIFVPVANILSSPNNIREVVHQNRLLPTCDLTNHLPRQVKLRQTARNIKAYDIQKWTCPHTLQFCSFNGTEFRDIACNISPDGLLALRGICKNAWSTF
jgi:hypothetical protein